MATVSLLRARPHPHPLVRHPARTRERILAAALREFSDKGFAGARVDRIARRARINKRMLYHYFGNKERLFREILSRKVRERAAWAVTAPDDAAESLAFWFDTACRDRDWVRLMEWEALGRDESGANGDAERRAAFREGVGQVRERQARGLLRADVDPGHLLLAMVALTTFPAAFPQFTRLLTGFRPTDQAFATRHAAFLRRLADGLRPVRQRQVSEGRR
jgi:TetR/AcrR family transcriptional regulator